MAQSSGQLPHVSVPAQIPLPSHTWSWVGLERLFSREKYDEPPAGMHGAKVM